MKKLRHASLDKYVIYALSKFCYFLLNIKEDVLAQKIHVKIWIFVFPDCSFKDRQGVSGRCAALGHINSQLW